MKMIFALAAADIKITMRRSEALILNLVIPVAVLIALSKTNVDFDKLIPFTYVQAVLSVSMVSLGITTGFDRRFRVLVRLGTTPLGRKGLVFSKIVSMIFVETIQLIVLSAIALFLGWHPSPSWLLAFPLCWIASCAFAGIALLIAGSVKAEANLGLQNLAYIVLIGLAAIGLGGAASLPPTVRDIVHIVPSGALNSLLRTLAGSEQLSTLALVALIIQAIALPLLAARKFSFDE